MDRRQRKTREAIFNAFIELLSKKSASSITVGEIIEKADIGRATFYSHFETKDHLLSEMCDELFCHIFDSMDDRHGDHKHIFDCDAPSSVYLHLFRHLQKNDNHILELLCDEQNEVFLRYFKKGLLKLAGSTIGEHPEILGSVPKDYFANIIAATFIETVRWWVKDKMRGSPEEITGYFLVAIGLNK